MLKEQDFYESYPVIHEDADLLKVQQRLAWLWKMNHTNLLGALATCWYNTEAVKRFNQAFAEHPEAMIQ